MPWILLGLAVALVAWFTLRYARGAEHQVLASIALWGVWVGFALVAIGLAYAALRAGGWA